MTRYFTARRHSEYFVAVPTRAAIHIQNKAPGPPATRAVATPTILPVPIVADKAVQSDNYTILGYPSDLVEQYEYSFIEIS